MAAGGGAAQQQVWEVVGGSDKGGILVRAGAALKSPEAGRLACGALVRQVELKGDRLHFRKLAGEGPWSGWVSLKLKDKDLVQKYEKTLPVYAGPIYSIIVYGCTGYTGGLICEHLDAMLSRADAKKHRWAVAGRSRDKLQKLSDRLKTKPEIVVATSEHEVEDMVCQCRVVLSAAGPYLLCGEPVVRACAECGTDYVDITGEIHWIRAMIDRYDAKAKETGAVLINLCGQDSLPPDVTVHQLVAKLGPLRNVHAYMFAAGSTSGGTQLSNTTGIEQNLEAYLQAQNDPFFLGGQRKAGVREIDKDCKTAEQCTLFPNLWLAPTGGSVPDTRCVRRTCELFDGSEDGLRYGDDFAFIYRDAGKSELHAAEIANVAGPIPNESAAQHAVAQMQKAVRDGLAPRPGLGAPAETRMHWFSTLIAAGEGEDGKWAYCVHKAPEAYEVTAIGSVTASLVLCEERDVIVAKKRAGLLTPAFALFGTTFVERLSKSPFADACERTMEWEVHEGKPESALLEEAMMKRTKGMATSFGKVRMGELKLF